MAPTSSLLAAGLLAASAAAAPLEARASNGSTGVTFDDIKASTQLKWTDCYEKPLQCAKLTLPLDYSDSKAGTVDIAYARYLLNETAEDLMFNPG